MRPHPDIPPPTLEELDRPDSSWNRAAVGSRQGDPFSCRTEWQLSLQSAYFPRRRLHLRRNDTSLLALAERRYPDLGPTLEPLDPLWLFGSPLLGPDALELLEAFLAERSAAAEPTTTLVSGVLPGETLRERLLRRLGSRFEVYRVKTVTVCRADLANGLDGFLARRSRALRKGLRQAARRAGDRGIRFERVVARSPREADAAFRRILAVERRSWKGIAGRGIESPASNAFYAAMARRLAASASGRIIFARIDERDVGYVFGGLADDHYRGQQFSYDEAFADCSIGNLLQQEQVRWLAEEGIRHYDMGPLMAYKRHWTEQRISMEVLLLRERAHGGGRDRIER
ncbi:MAG: GNAT family N-acetyltransferase [Myxococcota bacterium]